MDQITVVHQFADQGIDLAQTERGLRTTLKVAPHETIFVHAHLEGCSASFIDGCGAELFGERENAQDAAHALQTWLPLAVWWCRGCAYPPSLLPSDPDRLAPVPDSRSVVLSEEFFWCGPRLTPLCLFDLDPGSGRVGRPHRNGRACRDRVD